MSEKRQLEFSLLRYVPDAVKDEFVNIGLVMVEPGGNERSFADVRFTRDWRRVQCLDPGVDLEALEALERDIRGKVGDLADRHVFLSKLQDSLSNLVQLSPTKGCLAEDPAREIEELARLYLERPKLTAKAPPSVRQKIVAKMRDAFAQAGVLDLMLRELAMERYTKAGDPLKIDFGYRVGEELKMFHAVSLKASVDQAITLAYRFPRIADGFLKAEERALARLTAVVEDDLPREEAGIRFALSTLEENRMQVAVASEMPAIAERARVELRA